MAAAFVGACSHYIRCQKAPGVEPLGLISLDSRPDRAAFLLPVTVQVVGRDN